MSEDPKMSFPLWHYLIPGVMLVMSVIVLACSGIVFLTQFRRGQDIVGLPVTQKEIAIMERVKRKNGNKAVSISGLDFDLTGMQLQDEDLVTLAGIYNLHSLNLSRTNIRDSQLKLLASNQWLEQLDLSYTDVSDAGMESVKKMFSLRSLNVEGTKVTPGYLRDLREEMPGIRAQLHGPESNYFGNGVHASLDRFVLVQYERERIAFKFTQLTRRGEGGAKYVWYHWHPDMHNKFAREPTDQGEGEVFEKYRVVKKSGGETFVENDGGELSLRLGPVQLPWSKSKVVYFPQEFRDPPKVKIALTSWEKAEDIDFDDQLLKWYEKEGF